MSGTRGLSLIELVVTMALFALVAVMGMQTLNGTIRTRDALTDRDSRDRDLAVTLALLRSDLSRTAPLLFFPPDSPPQSALYAGAEGMLGLSVSVTSLAEAAVPFQRAEWRFDRREGTLSRGMWPVTTPARSSQRSPDRVVLTGVQRVRLRSYWRETGWVEGTGANPSGPVNTGPDAADGDAAFARVADVSSDTLPLAIEVTLTVDGLGDIRMLETLK